MVSIHRVLQKGILFCLSVFYLIIFLSIAVPWASIFRKYVAYNLFLGTNNSTFEFSPSILLNMCLYHFAFSHTRGNHL